MGGRVCQGLPVGDILNEIKLVGISQSYIQRCGMSQSTVFKSNKTQAVRLPKAVALPEHVKRVEIIRLGSARLVMPTGGSWEAFFDGPRLDADFLSDRAQPAPQRRSAI